MVFNCFIDGSAGAPRERRFMDLGVRLEPRFMDSGDSGDPSEHSVVSFAQFILVCSVHFGFL